MALPNGPLPSASATEVSLFRMVDTYDIHYEAAAAELALTAAQACVLGRIDTPMRMSQLAEDLHCDASNVTQIVSKLEAMGLATRATDPEDGRARVVSITPEGSALSARFEEEFSFGRTAVARLTEAEQSQLTALLSKALGEARGS